MSQTSLEAARARVRVAQRALDEARQSPNTSSKRDRLVTARRVYEAARADLAAATRRPIVPASFFSAAAVATIEHREGAYV